MSNTYNQLLEKLKQYKQKYYKNLLLKGTILTVALCLSAFTVINAVEYFGNLNKVLRGTLFFSFLGLSFISFYSWILIPLLRLFELNKPISNTEASLQIGKYFPEVNDKLLNLLQLGELNKSESSLIQASIEQKAKKLNLVDFKTAIDYRINKKYLKYLLPPFFFFSGIFMIFPQLFTESTPRIVNYTEEFNAKAPFQFSLINSNLEVFKNEDFEVKLQMKGAAMPNEVFLINESGRKIRMERKAGSNEFTYLFKNIQKAINFYFEASGFNSTNYEINILERPNLSQFTAFLHYPPYVKKADEQLENTGNLVIPQGTQIQWKFKTQQTENLKIKFGEKEFESTSNSKNTFEFSKQIMESAAYSLMLKNQFSGNKEKIEYFINVIPDEFPTVNLKQYEDTTLYNYLIIGGNIADDYGITKLQLKYKISAEGEKDAGNYQSMPIEFNPSLSNQSYFQQLEMSKFNLKQGEKLEYFVEVWDNDGIKGSKNSKSSTYQFRLPSKEEFKKEVENSISNAEKGFEKTLKKAQDLRKDLKVIQDKLKSKKDLNWQDQKALEEVLKKKEEIDQDIKKLQDQNQMLNEKQERFSKRDEQIARKVEQLNQMMDELLDEETKRLYEELNQMMQNEMNEMNIQELLEQINKKENNTEKELDRALEMFKKLQYEQKMKEVVKDLKDLSKDQEKLAEESKKMPDGKSDKDLKDQDKDLDKKDSNKKDSENKDSDKKDSDEKNSENKDSDEKSLEERQQDLKKEFEQIQKAVDELEKLNKEMEKEQSLPENMEQKEQKIEKEQKDSKESLQKKQNKKAAESQKKAAEEMKKMAQEMQQSMESEEMEQQTEDYNDLRKILENLVKLSFDEEDLMKNFKGIRPEDPRLVPLGQKQLKLKDDAKIIEDSLTALAKRVFQIQTFVTREVTAMNDYMNQSTEEIRKRNLGVAAGKQQLAMTAMNNLALMLDDVLHQMQQNMGQQMGGMQIINKKRKDQQMSEMQKSLNQQLQELKQGNKQGKELSEQLAKMAAQQQAIRKALENAMKGKEGKNKKDGDSNDGGGELGDLLDEMEKTEEDLVNKRITQELLNRQKQIMTRLLESEKAMRERETDQKREAETAKTKERKNPADFSDYLKLKEKQIELLKTIPASLNPYYKKEVNEYFKKLNNQ